MSPPKQIASKELLLRIARGGLAELEWEPASWGELDADRSIGRRQAAFEAIRLAAALAAWQPAPEVVPMLCRAIPLTCGGYRETSVTDLGVIARGARRLIEEGAGRPGLLAEVERLSKSTSREMRYAVATALAPDGEGQIAILRRLARDRDPEVSEAARVRLGGQHAPPWWDGIFAADPLTGAEPGLRAPVERVVTLLRMARRELAGHADELARLVEALPSALASQAAAAFLIRPDWFAPELPGQALARRLLEAEGGTRGLLTHIRRWLSSTETAHLGAELVTKWLAECAPSRREALCLELLALLRNAQAKERDEGSPLAMYLSELIGSLWPPTADARPVLEAALGVTLEQAAAELEAQAGGPAAEEEDLRSVADSLWLTSLVEKCPLDLAPLMDLLVRAHEADYPGAWRRISSAASRALALRVDPRVRSMAERMLFAGDQPSRWALSYLAGPGHDPGRDPPPRDLLRRAFSDPRLRRAVLGAQELLLLVLPEARVALRADELDLEDIAWVRNATHALWGSPRGDRYLDQSATRAAKREELAARLAPDPVPGPLDAADWAVVRRRVRAEVPKDDHARSQLLHHLPPLDSRTEEDWAVFEDVVARWRRAPVDDPMADAIEAGLSLFIDAAPAERALPVLDEIVIRARRRRDGESAAFAIRTRRRARASLNLDPDAPLPGPERAAEGAPRDWLDEPDDDEEV